MIKKIKEKFFSLPFLYHKIIYITFIGILFVGLYTLVGHVYIGTPKELPLTYVDKKLPLIPQTFWIYISDYLFLVIVGLSIPNYKELFRFKRAFLCTMFFHLGFFFVFPTSSLRPNTIEGEGISIFIGKLIHMLDAKTNCFPSLHVSMAILGALVVSKFYKKYTLPIFIWAISIAISTMTTKQHYFYDVISGTLIGIIIFSIFYCFPTKKDNN